MLEKIIVIVLVILLFLGTYLLNQSTDIPEECKKKANDAKKCAGCHNRETCKGAKDNENRLR